jgi:photosystem II stability/assembly factor-like uncharacterized protein
MALSEDGGKSWTNRSKGLAVTAYHKIDVAQSDPRCYGGTTEANGTLITTTGRPDDHLELLGNEGGRLVFDPNDPAHAYVSYYGLRITQFRGHKHDNVSPPATASEQWSSKGILTMDPSNSKTLFTGSWRVWRTISRGLSWKPISPSLDGSSISAIEVSRSDRYRLYAGTEQGGIFRSLDGGDSWSHNIAGALLPSSSVTSIESSPHDADVVFVAIAGFSRSHVFRSDNAGVSWTDVDQGALPDVPPNTLVIPTDDADSVYVCNQVGVFVSKDQGKKWQNLTGNLPNAVMTDLVYHEKEGALYVGTFGRGIWRVQIR